jgi:hypothetical protein
MKAYEGMDVQISIFLTLRLVGGELSASLPSRFARGGITYDTHWIGG